MYGKLRFYKNFKIKDRMNNLYFEGFDNNVITEMINMLWNNKYVLTYEMINMLCVTVKP